MYLRYKPKFYLERKADEILKLDKNLKKSKETKKRIKQPPKIILIYEKS